MLQWLYKLFYRLFGPTPTPTPQVSGKILDPRKVPVTISAKWGSSGDTAKITTTVENWEQDKPPVELTGSFWSYPYNTTVFTIRFINDRWLTKEGKEIGRNTVEQAWHACKKAYDRQQENKHLAAQAWADPAPSLEPDRPPALPEKKEVLP